ncbi:MAG: transglutaminase-like domain-containing protein [Phycisphaerae bacterium]|nr:transglutaminase-like domain-containing protein [Phycisphaerae bacterium]
MTFQRFVLVAVWVCIVIAGCDHSPDDQQGQSISSVPVFSKEIQAGIEKHITEQTRLGNGHMRLDFEGEQLALKLVKVHTEYLAKLGPGEYFACVDLASDQGNVYDVDFFLKGDIDAMNVSETTVHKVNGKPLYVWKQDRDGTWERRPEENAPLDLLGVIKGHDEFEFFYRAVVPEIREAGRMWIPLPSSDAFQTIDMKSIKTPGKQETLQDREHGNQVLFLKLTPADSQKTIELAFRVRRLEKGVYREDVDPALYLQAENLVPRDTRFNRIAQEVVNGKTGDLVRARALYDYVIKEMRYAKYGSGWGKGDAVFACDAQRGNCTDFHSYFIALARSVGIPARFAIGASIPSERDAGGVDGYHCWAEFYTDGSWWPVDISEGDKCSSLSTYFFGHHPANRIEFSKGRDLVLDPGPQSGPINFLAYPVLEVGGKPEKVKVEFTFKRTVSRKTSAL